MQPKQILGGTGGAFSLVFDGSLAPGQAEGNLFGPDWASLCDFLVSLPDGSQSTITFRTNFTLPIAGMPPGGWFMRGATWTSITPVTGAIAVDIPDGVSLDCGLRFSIDRGLVVFTHPTTEYGVFKFQGNVWVLSVSNGADVVNLGAPGIGMIVSPGLVGQTFVVFASVQAELQNGGPPPSTAPFVDVKGTDVALAIQNDCGPSGGLPDNWVAGDPGTTLRYTNGIDSSTPLIPLFLGAVIIGNGGKASNVPYIPGVSGDWDPIPAQVAAALDQLAARLSTAKLFWSAAQSLTMDVVLQVLAPGSGPTPFQSGFPGGGIAWVATGPGTLSSARYQSFPERSTYSWFDVSRGTYGSRRGDGRSDRIPDDFLCRGRQDRSRTHDQRAASHEPAHRRDGECVFVMS